MYSHWLFPGIQYKMNSNKSKSPSLRGKSKPKPARQGGFSQAAPLLKQSVSAPSARSSMLVRQGNESDLVVTGRELWGTTNTQQDTVTTYTFVPGGSSLTRVDAYGKLFDLYRVESLSIEYVPSAGTNNNGRTVIGIDYDTLSNNTTTASVNVLNPLISTPIWQEGQVSLSPERMNKQFWLRTSNTVSPSAAAFAACSYVTGATSGVVGGQIWVRYRIRFTSPRDANSTLLVRTIQSNAGPPPTESVVWYGSGSDAYLSGATDKGVKIATKGRYFISFSGADSIVTGYVASLTTNLLGYGIVSRTLFNYLTAGSETRNAMIEFVVNAIPEVTRFVDDGIRTLQILLVPFNDLYTRIILSGPNPSGLYNTWTSPPPL